MVEKRFEKLGMPDIERFENYLPTAFNSELTLLQKVNKIIQDLNRSFDLTNEMVDYLNRFIESFDEKLYETLEDVLNVWLEDGRLADIVRVAISEEVIEARTDYLGKKYVNLKERLDDERKEVILARDGAQTLGERLDSEKSEVSAQLSQTNAQLSQTNAQLAQTTKNGMFVEIPELTNVVDVTGFNSTDYYNLYDKLLTDDRMRVRHMGFDQSDTYPINLYLYEPDNYNRTIFINCAIHGWEHYTTYIIYEMMKKLLNDKELPEQFRPLRNTRILVLPCSNPWAMHANPQQRSNSRGVDLNRNFDYKFEENEGAFGLSKGEYPFSEKETQIIKEVMESYHLTHFLDFHNFDDDVAETRDYLFYANEKIEKSVKQLVKWLTKIHPEYKGEITTTVNDSAANNYASEVRDISAINIELIKGRHGSLTQDATRWLEIVMNFLNLQAQNKTRSSYGTRNGSKLIKKHTASFSYDYPAPLEWTVLEDMNLNIDVETDGIVIVSGWMVIEFLGEVESIFNFSPSISQDQLYKIKPINERSRAFLKNKSGSHYVPFQEVLTVRKGFGDVAFKMTVIKEGGGSVVIKRRSVDYLFLPTDNTYANIETHDKVVEW